MMMQLLALLLYCCVLPLAAYGCFCRLLRLRVRWYMALAYMALSCGLAVLEARTVLTGFPAVLLGIALLAVLGMAQKCGWAKALAASTLVLSLQSVMNGITQSLVYWLLSSLSGASLWVLKYADVLRHGLTIALFLILFGQIARRFAKAEAPGPPSAMLLLVIPVLFITLAEKTISKTVFGDTVVWDSAFGLVAPVVNNAELLALRLLACAGLFAALIAYQKLLDSLNSAHALRMLEQQTQHQQAYLREAQLREQRTRSFRHDIKNHLLVLRRLLAEAKPEEAERYLGHLEQLESPLSVPVHTGNAAADALLGSKLAVAASQGIPVDCALALPEGCAVTDIDWCILLSNAVDNAITASGALPQDQRRIRLSGKRRGGFYLLMVENRCAASTALPKEGTGLANIRAVTERYGGSTQLEIKDGLFRLSMLLVISHQSGDIPHPNG